MVETEYKLLNEKVESLKNYIESSEKWNRNDKILMEERALVLSSKMLEDISDILTIMKRDTRFKGTYNE